MCEFPSLFPSLLFSSLSFRRAFNIIGELRRIFLTLDIPPLLRNNTGKCVPHTVSQEYFINKGQGRVEGGEQKAEVRLSIRSCIRSRVYKVAAFIRPRNDVGRTDH